MIRCVLASQLQMFGANIFLLIGLLILCGFAFFLLIAGWTALRIVLWKRTQRRAEQAYRRQRVAPDGTPYPPAARGICRQCARGRDLVYHLPNGERLCRDHFDARQTARVKQKTALGDS